MVTMRSSSGMNDESTLSSVVLPEPVPPEMTMFLRACTAAPRNVAICSVIEPNPIRSGMPSSFFENLRMVIAGPLQRQRRDDRVDAAAVLQARVDHRHLLVDAPAERRDDALDDAAQLLVAEEADVAEREVPLALDVDLVDAVDHDLGDRRIVEQVLERAEAERLVHQLLDQLPAVLPRDARSPLPATSATSLPSTRTCISWRLTGSCR